MTLLAALAWLRNHQEGKIKYRERLYIWGSEIKLSEVFDTEHDGWSVVEPPELPKKRTRIVPVRIDGNRRYWIDELGTWIDDIFSFCQWTGRVEVTFADGRKELRHFSECFRRGTYPGSATCLYKGQDSFSTGIISGVEFWEA